MELEKSGMAEQTVGATYASLLSLRRQAKLKALIGKKCMVDCFFEGVATQALWDTGSQVTIINESWRKSCLPHMTETIIGLQRGNRMAIPPMDKDNYSHFSHSAGTATASQGYLPSRCKTSQC